MGNRNSGGTSAIKNEPQKSEGNAVLDVSTIDAKTVSKALNKFATDLYSKMILLRPNENIFFSPLSIALALALTETGASGQTRQEIRQLIAPEGLPESVECDLLYGSLQNDILPCFQVDGDGRLCIANNIVYDSNIPIKPSYLQNAQILLKAAVTSAPFSNDPERARNLINLWINEKTNGNVTEMIKSLSSNASVVIVNAVFLETRLKNKFQQKDIGDGTFFNFGLNTGHKVKYLQMRENCFFKSGMYLERADLQLIEMPYDNEDLCMYVLLPTRRDGLKHIESQLNRGFLIDLVQKMYCPEAAFFIKIPQFLIRMRPFDLVPLFKQLGFHTFDKLSHMSNNPRIIVSEAIHESYIKLDQTETAAAPPTPCCSDTPPESVNFIADHPFLYFIVHIPTMSIMFMGKVNEVEGE